MCAEVCMEQVDSKECCVSIFVLNVDANIIHVAKWLLLQIVTTKKGVINSMYIS